MEKKVKDLLMSLGITPNIMGFAYLVRSICIWAEWSMAGRKHIRATQVYDALKLEFGKSANSCEKAIRNAITQMVDHCSLEAVSEILGCPPSLQTGTYRNSQFIALCATKIMNGGI